MLFVAAAAVFLSASLLSWALLHHAFSDESHVRRRLAELSSYEAGELARIEPLLLPFYARVMRPVVLRLVAVARRVLPSDYAARIRREFALAGLQGTWSVDRFLAIKILGTFVGIGAAAVLRVSTTFTGPISLAFSAGLIGLGYFAVDLFIMHESSKRQTAIRRELPEMLDMLTISVEAGLGFDQAMTKLVRNRPGPLSQEFGRMLQETQAGAARRDALHHVSERTSVEELRSFVTALVQADAFGVSTTAVLRAQAQELRLRRRQLAEERAQKAPVKQVFPLVLCILPATILVVAGPAMVQILAAFGAMGW